MSLSSQITWEVRADGNDLNGGGFRTGASGTDYSLQTTAPFPYNDLAIDPVTATNVSSAAIPFTSTHVGNILNITGGTGFTTGRYEVISVANNIATLDRAAGTIGSTGGAGRLGGSLATPGMAAGVKVAGNDVFIKAGTYTITSSAPNVSGGIVNEVTGGIDSSNCSAWIGYDTTRTRWNNDANRPRLVLSTGLTGVTVFTQAGSASYLLIRNFWIDCANQSGTTAILTLAGNAATLIENCRASNFTSYGFWIGSFGTVARVAVLCELRVSEHRV